MILDRKGHSVPDGTPVEFRLRYPAEALELAPQVETTVAGRARTTVALDRQGELWITAQAGEAKDSTRLLLKVGSDTPGSVATVLPSPTPAPTATPTPRPSPTSSPEPTPAPTATPQPVPPPAPQPRVTPTAFFFGLLGAMAASGTAFAIRRRRLAMQPGTEEGIVTGSTAAALWATASGWLAYLLYALGWLPGATETQTAGRSWVAGAVTLVGGLLSLLWSGRERAKLFAETDAPGKDL